MRTIAKWKISVLKVLIFAVLSGQSYCQADPNNLSELMEQITAAIRATQTFSEVLPVLDLRQRKEILAKIAFQELSNFLTIDEQHVIEHFQKLDDSARAKIFKQQNLLEPKIELDEYLSIPFFEENKPAAEGQPGQVGFVISGKILSAPVSTKMQYTSMLKAYSALAHDLKVNPSGWTHGLSTLIAQDFSYRSALAACPDLEVETAIAALLSAKNKDLVWDAFLDDSRFNIQSYTSNIRTAITSVGSETPDEAIKELLRSPEEYYALFQQENAQRASQKEQDPNAVGFLPPVSPPMRICMMILPSTEAGLHEAANYAMNNINHATLRFVLLNACYDKLCYLTGQTKTGQLFDSAMLLNAAVDGELKEAGYDPTQLIQDFEKRQGQVWQEFKAELQKRQQPEDKLQEMAYDPSTLKWAFRFLYNYSLPIRKTQKELKDKIKAENPAANQEQIDKLLAEQVTPEMVLRWWREDPYICKLLDTVGNPNIEVRPSRFSRTGVELDCRWNLRRKGTQDVEQVRIYIIDPASSGGGKPLPGVSPETKVIVRKTLSNVPEAILLKDIQPGFYIQTVDNLNSEAEMHQDWARVVSAQQTPPTMPWSINSGAQNPLEVGRKQFIRVRTGDSGGWTWMLPLPLRANKDNLLGISPEIPEGNHTDTEAVFFAANVKETAPRDKSTQLIIITLSHAEVEEVKKSGIGTWGYFANARFVQADVFPSAEGVDGQAIIELPSGQKPVDSLQKASRDNPGDKVNAFAYENPKTFVDDVCNLESKAVDYSVKFTYTLPSGKTASILVAEGQQLVVCESTGDTVKRKRAYQLDLNHQLVCGFNTDGSPVKAKIENIEGREGHLGAYKLQLGQCPLVRINGILIPVATKPSFVSSGIDEESMVQMSPPLNVVRESSSDYIDLSNSSIKQAKNVGAKDLLLMYNHQSDPRKFWQTEIHRVDSSRQDRYVRIVTKPATLVCGHLQEIYTTKGGWEGLDVKQASDLRPGDIIVWLHTGASDSNSPHAQTATFNDAKPGSIHLVPVEKVEEIHTSPVTLRQFIAADTGLSHSYLQPNVFANGILVKIRMVEVGPEGEDLGNLGPAKGKSKTPREPGLGQYRPDLDGVVRDVTIKTPPIKFDDEDLLEFDRNKQLLQAAFDAYLSKNPNPSAARTQVMQRFLRQYFANPPELSQVYQNEYLEQSFHNYTETRNFFISTGDYKVLPALVNGYVFMGTIAYEGEAKELGDALTRDWLCIAARTLNKPGGKHFYGSDQLFRVRTGLMLTRDVLLYIRDRCTQDGFVPVTHIEFDAESFENVLNYYFVQKQSLSKDICTDHKVNMYNLCRQLDLWAEHLSGIPESTLAPGFTTSGLFTDEAFRRNLGIQQRQESLK
jgi:hypothetical protein